MRNRAKCSLCNVVLESFHLTDYVSCECGEIGIRGGPSRFECYAKDFKNFKRVDDLDNEFEVKVLDEEEEVKPLDNDLVITKEEVLLAVKEMIINYENLPPHALSAAITGYDLLSVLFLLQSALSIEE